MDDARPTPAEIAAMTEAACLESETTKQCREMLTAVQRALRTEVPSRELSLAITKLDEAIHWINHHTANMATGAMD